MKKIVFVLLIVLIILGIIFIPKYISKKDVSKDKVEEEVVESNDLFGKYYTKANKVLKNMTIEEKVGQLFLVRYDVNYAPRWVKNNYAGGFILFAKDFNGKTKETINKELNNLKDMSSNGLIISSVSLY